jgi:hypothetical protein
VTGKLVVDDSTSPVNLTLIATSSTNNEVAVTLIDTSTGMALAPTPDLYNDAGNPYSSATVTATLAASSLPGQSRAFDIFAALINPSDTATVNVSLTASFQYGFETPTITLGSPH